MTTAATPAAAAAPTVRPTIKPVLIAPAEEPCCSSLGAPVPSPAKEEDVAGWLDALVAGGLPEPVATTALEVVAAAVAPDVAALEVVAAAVAPDVAPAVAPDVAALDVVAAAVAPDVAGC